MRQKVKRVPVQLQMETVECGAVSLGMVLAYWHRFIPREVLRADCGISRDGCSAGDLLRAAGFHGLKASAVRTTAAALRRRTDLPIILHWNGAHFVVLCGFRKNRAVINDPACGRMLVSAEEFERSFTGIALPMKPSEAFQTTDRSADGSSWRKSALRELKPLLLALLLLGLLSALLQLPQSVFYRFFTDSILLRGTDAGLNRLLTVMAATALLTLLVRWLQSCCAARMTERRIRSGSRAFVKRLLRLPESFFDRRTAGDLISRLTGLESLERFRCAGLIPTLIDLVMSVIYLAVILRYQLPLALVGLGFAVVDLWLLRAERRMNGGSAAKLERDTLRVNGVTLSVISMIEQIKACGAEEGTFRRISGSLGMLSHSGLEWRRKTEGFAALVRIVSGLANGVILFLGIWYIFRGKSSIGLLMAFQGLLQQLLAPARALAGASQGLQLAEVDARRVDDVMDCPVQDVFSVSAAPSADDAPPLRGELELSGVSFRYSRLSRPILRDFSLRVPAGSTVVLTGSSGCGKSTVLRLLAGQYPPDAGEIRYDGIPAARLSRAAFVRSVSVVDQRIALFGGSIRDNLTLWDRSVPEEALIRACRDAEIYETVLRQERGLDSMLLENGRNFSGGQRQQLELARALVKDPSVLLLDEATSALDPITEKKVMDNLRRRGVTCLVVAHRLSAIRDADRILVLKDGVIAEQGTHDGLAAAGGIYAELVGS